MPRSLKRVGLAVLAVVASLAVGIPLVIYGWHRAARFRGEYQAYQDVRSGHYVELGYGLPAAWRKDFAEIVHRKHPEAEFRVVAGCIVTPELQDYVTGYNSYMKQAAARHFGHDVFEEAADDAAKSYKANRDFAERD